MTPAIDPMKTGTLILALLASCSAVQPVASNTHDYYSAQELRYEDHVYSPTVHTVQFFKRGFELSPAILRLGGEESLVLRFDDFNVDAENLSFTVVHCTALWQPSDLSPSQYIHGVPTDFVPSPRQSFNTTQPFLAYELEFPNEMMRPSVAGNYLLKVFRGTDQDDLVLTRRFLVFEDRVQVSAAMVPTRNVERRDMDQQLDLTLRYPGIPVPDPFSDLQVVVLQNNRWDDARTGLRPKFIRDAELVYDHPKEGLFHGGNEWRGVDLKNLRYTTLRVSHYLTSPEGLTEAVLLPDEKREFKVYLDLPDINGKYLVKNDLVPDDPLSADYVYVDFTLPRSQEQVGGEVYVYGAISDFQCKKEFRCAWNEARKAYTARIPIKQGYFDHVYAFLPNGGTVPDLTLLEGSHYQTENEYVVLVYVKDYQLRCDRLLGLRFLNSRKG
ncbi:MAG: DUF5103 domain-containing protein [Flavobacteriales bacterium]|nr:DUF5103 domain-containing protein [Flavobacteriales bacterium]MBP9079379.1 DUF5103 domain-containing protein [Flavobacteriales bacterium]